MGAENLASGKQQRQPRSNRNRRRRRIEPYRWLAAGATGVGITAAALAGAGIAYADDVSDGGDGTDSSETQETDSTRTDDANEAGDEPTSEETTDTAESGEGDEDGDVDEGEDAEDEDSEDTDGSDGGDVEDTDEADDDEDGDDPDADEPDDPDSTITDPEPAPEPEDEVTPPPSDRTDRDESNSEQTIVDEPSIDIDSAAADFDEKSEPASSPQLIADKPETVATPPALDAKTIVIDPAALRQPASARTVAAPAASYMTQVQTAPQPQSPAVPRWSELLVTLVRMQSAPVTQSNRSSVAQPQTPTGQTTGLMARTVSALAASVVGQPPYDAGLNAPFVEPTYPTGTIRNVRDYGATSNNPNDNDAAAIQAAINASQPGDAVYIPNGTYHVYSTINLKSGVSLAGQSRTGTVLVANSETPLHAVVYAPPGTNNLIVQSMRITVADGRAISAGVRLGIEGGANVSRITVRDMQIERFTRFGVQIVNGNNILVDGNIIRNAAALDGGGQGYGVIIDQAGSNNNWVRNNTIGPTIRHAILIQESAHHNLIDNNRITGAVSGAIDLHGEDEYSNEIRYNVISDCVPNGTSVSPNGAGIEIGEYSGTIGDPAYHDNSGPNNWIHHNEVYNCACGLRVTNNSNYNYIEDNRFHDNWDAGIRADLAPLNNLYIRRNQIYNNNYGILLYDVTNAVVENNTVRNNRYYGIGGNQGTTGYYVAGNTVTGSQLNYIFQNTNGYLDVRDGARRV